MGEANSDVLNNTLAVFDESGGDNDDTVMISLTSVEYIVCAGSDPKDLLFLTSPLIVPVTVHFVLVSIIHQNC